MEIEKIKKSIEDLGAQKIKLIVEEAPIAQINDINKKIQENKKILKEEEESEKLKKESDRQKKEKEEQEILNFLTKDCNENIDQKFFTEEYINLYKKFYIFLSQNEDITFGNDFQGKISLVIQKDNTFILEYYFHNYRSLFFKINFEKKESFIDFLKSITFIEQRASTERDWREMDMTRGNYTPSVSECITGLFESFEKIIK